MSLENQVRTFKALRVSESAKGGQEFGNMPQQSALGLILLLCLSCCPKAANAYPKVTQIIAPQLTTQNNTFAEAERLVNEGAVFFQQRTPESLRAALAKYKKALSVYQILKITQKIAKTLTTISYVYDALGETITAVEYHKQALPLLQRTVILQKKNTRVELSYAPGFVGREQSVNTLIHLKISRGRQLFFDKQLPAEPQTIISSSSWYENGEVKKEVEPLVLQDLDGDGEPEIIIDIYSGQHMHCCFYSLIFRFEPKRNRYTYIDYSWKNTQYILPDLDGDGIPEFKTRDDRFAYQFASFAGSVFPLQVWQYRQGKMLNATRQYTEELKIDSKRMWQHYLKLRDEGGEVKGVLAAYLASQYLLTKEQEAWHKLEQVYKNSDASEYFSKLRTFLEANGYTGKNLAQEPEVTGSPVRDIQQYEYWLDIARSAKNPEFEARWLKELGFVYLRVGEFQKALDSFNQLLFLMKKIDDFKGKAVALTGLGNTYGELGEQQKALEFYNQALKVYSISEDKEGESVIRNNIGIAYLNLGNYQEAIKSFNKALTLIETSHEQVGIVIISNIGSAYAKLGNNQKAIEYFTQALSLAQHIPNTSMEAQALHNLGSAFQRLRKYDKALDYLEQSLSLRQAVGEITLIPLTLSSIASVEYALGDLNEALARIEEALEIIESLRVKVISPELRTSYFATVQTSYQLYIELLMELHQKKPSQGYDKKAFHVSERSRARTLLELLTEANVNMKEGINPQLLVHEKSLQAQLDATEMQRLDIYNNPNSTTEQKAAIDRQHKTLLEQYQNLQNEIRARSPKYAALKYPNPLTLEQVQQQVLDDDTVLLQYSLGQDKSYLWVVTKEEMTSYQLPAKEKITERAFNLLRIIKQGNQNSFDQAEPLLSQVILAQAKDKLTKKRLLIVADGVLQYVPFSVLSLSGDRQSLINKFEIVNVPSSSSLATIRNEIQARKSATKTVAIIADPVFSNDDPRLQKGKANLSQQPSDLGLLALNRSVRSLEYGKFIPLPGTRTEAEDILKLVPENTQKTSVFDFDANLNAATNPQLSQYRIVHFATHGILNTQSPELSGVVFSLVNKNGNNVNGFMRLNEIFNLNLSADLIVVSACETGLGKEIKGEGLVGLTRGFMYAGSPRVLVSLWKVDDKATAEFMTRLYKLILGKKLPPAQALRETQLEMQQETEWKSPYYWAAFVLQGEWR